MQLEDLGFCGKGEGPAFIRKHSFTWDGSFPLNTSGGQLSVGQAGAAGGFLGMVEAIRQLTGEAGGRQVKDAKLGLVSGFGMINYDRGLGSGAAILANGTKAKEPGPAHAAADAAAGGAQPRRARPHRRGRARSLRAAAMPRMRHGAISAARGVPEVPFD